MFKQLYQKLVPTKTSLQKNRFIQWAKPLLNASPHFWHFNRVSVSRAIGIGLFGAFMLMPFQTLIVIVLALLFRANLPLSIGLIWLNNPLTVAPIYYFAYQSGAWLLNMSTYSSRFEMSYRWIHSQIAHIWQPFLLGTFICGTVVGIVGYLMTRGVCTFYKKA